MVAVWGSGGSGGWVSGMVRKPKKDKIEDEPGAEDRFLRGIRKALKTPHKPHKDEKAVGKPKAKKGT